MNETVLKFLSVLIPHLTVSIVFVGLLLRAVRRYENRADEQMKRMDDVYERQMQKYDNARDEIRASMRAQVDGMIAELAAHSPRQHSNADELSSSRQSLSHPTANGAILAVKTNANTERPTHHERND